MTLKTYSPGDVTITCGGFIIGGYADGTFIVIERTSDLMTKVVGADGDVARFKSSDKSGQLTLTLMPTSDSNETLGDFHALDELASVGTFSVIVKDNLKNILFTAEGWIRKLPNMEFGKELSDREWIIDLADVDYTFPSATALA